MAKVQIVGLRADREAVLTTLHRLGLLDLIPLTPSRPFELVAIRAGTPDRERISRLVSVIERLETMLASVRFSPTRDPGGEQADGHDAQWLPENPALYVHLLGESTAALMAAAESALAALEPPIQQLASTHAALGAEAATLKDYQGILERLVPLTEQLLSLTEYETVVLVIQPAFTYVIPTLREELAGLTQRQCEIVSAEAPDGAVTCLVVFNRRYSARVHTLLQGEQLSEIRLPPAYEGRPFGETLREIIRRLEQIPDEQAVVHRQLEDVARAERAQLGGWRIVLRDRLEELRSVTYCLESDHTFALAGWIPERDLPTLEHAVAAAFDTRVLIERLPVGRADWADMPVMIENPTVVRPFQVLLGLLPLPRYGTIDPTPFVGFFFSLFFGLVLADIGYGLVLLLAALWVGSRHSGPAWIRQVAQVLRIAALAAIAFGVAFGEFFGDLGHQFGLRPLLAERTDVVPALLIFSVGLGAVQVALGLVLGTINGYLERHYREALAKAATLLGLILVFVVLAIVADLLPRGFMTPSLVLLMVAVALLVYSVGISGPLELFGLLGNVLSYTRLVAVGLASVMLAQVANQLAGLTGSIVLGAIVGILFHGLNLALGIFSPSVQSLRLQYVEFFGRFFQPGGRPFHPFCSRLTQLAASD